MSEIPQSKEHGILAEYMGHLLEQLGNINEQTGKVFYGHTQNSKIRFVTEEMPDGANVDVCILDAHFGGETYVPAVRLNFLQNEDGEEMICLGLGFSDGIEWPVQIFNLNNYSKQELSLVLCKSFLLTYSMSIQLYLLSLIEVK